VKLFYLPNVPSSQRCEHTSQAIHLVLKQLRVPSIDLLIVSFPDVSFDADSEDEEEADLARTTSCDGQSGSEREDIDSMVEAWRVLEDFYNKGFIKRLGVAEFGASRLDRLLSEARVRPQVDQINVRDCCVVPEPLIKFARKEKIELFTHNDCTNILPPGTLRELLGPGDNNANVLAGLGSEGRGLKGDVRPQWVVKYTAVVKDRGVIENKGYFAAAELISDHE
jgi:glutamate--cysteine ligase regulatory subunit